MPTLGSNVRALQPLARIIGGVPQGDHKSASRRGQYRGHAAQLTIVLQEKHALYA